jgi:pyruvate dehydrogenase E1 component beta subunit
VGGGYEIPNFPKTKRGAHSIGAPIQQGRTRLSVWTVAMNAESREHNAIPLALMVPRALTAAEKLKSEHGIDCEVIDVRSLVPLDTKTILGSVARTHRLFTVEENPRLCGWGAELVSIVADEAFYDLDGPPVRITTPHIPLPAADILEDLALPSVDRIAERVQRGLQ